MKPGPKPRPVLERIRAKVPNWGGPGCWEFTGYRSNGYGQVGTGPGTIELAHRVVYRELVGPIGDGMLVCHRCDNPPCVRPDHLFQGTITDNNRDASAKFRLHVGEADGAAKLTADIVRTIRQRHIDEGTGPCALGRSFGVNEATIRDILAGRTWRHLLVEPRREQLALFEAVA